MLHKIKKSKNLFIKNPQGRPSIWKKQKGLVSQRRLSQILNIRGNNNVEVVRRKGHRYEIYYPHHRSLKKYRR